MFPQMSVWLAPSPPSALCSNVTFLKAFSNDPHETGILPSLSPPLTFLIPIPALFFFIALITSSHIYFIHLPVYFLSCTEIRAHTNT